METLDPSPRSCIVSQFIQSFCKRTVSIWTMRAPLKVTVCELTNNPEQLARQWERLTTHTCAVASDLVLLPEMPFSPWLAASNVSDQQKWHAAVESHRRWIARLPELGARIVIGTRPVTIDQTPYNQGFIWTLDNGPNVPGSDFGGTGWIIEPEEGAVLGTTSTAEPFLTMDIDPGWAEAAKTTYPRYVKE